MKKIFIKLSIVLLAIVTVSGCDGGIESTPFIPIDKVSEFTRDSISTSLEYNGINNRMSVIRYKVGDHLRSTSGIDYTSEGMSCTIDGLTYSVQLAATIGSSRVSTIRTSQGGGIVSEVEYQFKDGRLHLARLSRPAIGSDVWISYSYTENSIEINESGQIYSVLLSTTEKNTGNVCNVFAFAEAPLTNQYIINPALYFLNIYGTHFEKLPANQEILRNDDGRLSKVGKYHYRY